MQQHQFKPSQKKNGWDERRQVIFANPPTFTQRTRVGRDGDVGRGTYIGDGSEVLTDPELAGHRRLPSPLCCFALGRPINAILLGRIL